MGAVSCDEIGHGKRRATFTDQFNLALDEQERTYARHFRVKTSTPSDGPEVVVSEGVLFGLPRQWDAYPDDALALAKNHQVDETEDPQTWLVAVEYGLCPSPLDEPPLLTRTTGQTEWAVEEDVTGAAIKNAAGDPFDPPVTVPSGHQILTITKNMASVDGPGVVENYLFHVNATAFYGYPPGQVWLADANDRPAFRNGIHYRETSWVFHARKPRGGANDAETWDARPLNCGYREKVTAGGVTSLRTIRGPDGQPVSSPALLAADGSKLAPGGTPIFLDFPVYGTAEFNDIGINGART